MSAACAALLCAACQTARESYEPVQIALQSTADPLQPARIDVTGLAPAEISALERATLDTPAWASMFTVTLVSEPAPQIPPVEGRYAVTSGRVSFTPRFPFVPGRAYRVVFDPARMPIPRETPPVTATINLPAIATSPTTTVVAVYPASEVVPENLLRMYIEFSAPMGSSGAREFVRLIDRSGPKEEVVEGAFLPVEADFWSPDHRRYTLFLDPGRVKQDILPNRQSGRPLKAGRPYALAIDAAWTDANRQPLASAFRHEFRAGPIVDSAITLLDWKLTPPGAGTSDAVVVSFPRALDHGVVSRALGVETSEGHSVPGSSHLEAGDTRWVFTPNVRWKAGEHHLVAFSFLEDPQGNRINRPFEEVVDALTPVNAPDTFRISFTTQPARPSP